MKNIKLLILVLVATALLYACSPAEGDFPGSEYIPDMAHSIAYEANTYDYYYYNTWDSASTIKRSLLAYPRFPVPGTMPRGYAGYYFAGEGARGDSIMERMVGVDNVHAFYYDPNGFVPFYYDNSDSARLVATAEIQRNPFPITAAGLEMGKNLYTIYCGICHGEEGNGLGWLVAEENANNKYPVVPANLINDEFTAASNGRFYFAIMYGKNLMGPYADKLNYQERWQVIHYIRGLQAKSKSLVYNENENTLNPVFGTPSGTQGPLAEQGERAVPQTAEPQGPSESPASPPPVETGEDSPGEEHNGSDGEHNNDH